MLLRRIVPIAGLAVLAIGCEPDIAYSAPPGSVLTAVFDPTTSQIPIPNDLILQQDIDSLGLPAAQAELLKGFKAAGGFPNDQEVSATIDFQRVKINADGTTTKVAPDLDLTSLNAGTLIVFGSTAAGNGPIEIEPIKAADYVKGSDRGTLTIHNKGHQPWAPGEYFIIVRGGPNGVHATASDGGDAVYASQTFYLIAQGKDLTDPLNIGLIRAQTQTMQEALALAQQLNTIIGLYQPAFAVADQVFPHQEIAVLTTFAVAPAQTMVELDPGRGLAPLPIDLLRNPGATGKLTATAACALAQEPAATCLDSNGNPQGAAAGFAALDGFSTTAPLLASTNGLIQAATVTKDTVFLYDLTNPAAPVLVDPTTYINEPCEFTSACNDPTALSPVIAIQPAGATAGDATSVFRTRPLKDNTNYAFVISDKVLDKTGKGLGKASIGGILLFNNPLVVNGTSQLQGVDSATATALEIMRQALIPVKAKVLADKGISSDHIAMAYTFKTQTITSTAVQLAALPYTTPATTALTGAITTSTPAQAFAKFGVDPDLVPSSHISEIIETTITTFDLLDPATGAFRADATPAAITIPVLIAVPKLTAAPPLVAPVMVFRHGLGGGRADMLTVADTFNSKGMLVIAIDAAKHGDRTLCAKGDKTTCAGAAVCTSQLPAGAQGDANPPGLCPAVANSNGFNNGPVSPSCATNANCNWTGAYGVPLASSNFLISANFFRSRDTLRQDIIDQSQLIRAIAVAAPDPLHPAPFGHTVFDHLLGQGIVINAAQVFFSGQSLGAIQGTVDVASNPRISKAVLNVGGGTVVDIFTNSPAFKSGVLTLLQSLGISPGTSAYLQFLAVAKLILDPADPVNFAGHITGNNLPNLLPPLGGNTNGSVPQSPKKLLQQVAFCDQVVPNPFSFVWSSTAGTSPQLVAPTFGGPGNFQLFYTGTSAPTAQNLASCPAPGGLPIPSGAVQHAFITNWTDSFQTGKAQTDAANFVVSDTLPNSLVVLP